MNPTIELVPYALLGLEALTVWALVAMSVAGRTPVWYGMMGLVAIHLLVEIAGILGSFFHLDQEMQMVLAYVLAPVSAGFAVCFYFYAGRVTVLARRARELEEECAAMAARLGVSAPSGGGADSIAPESAQ